MTSLSIIMPKQRRHGALMLWSTPPQPRHPPVSFWCFPQAKLKRKPMIKEHRSYSLHIPGTQRGQARWRVDSEVGAKLEGTASCIQDDKGQDRATCSFVQQTVDGSQVWWVVCLCRVEIESPCTWVRSAPFCVTLLSLVWVVDGEQK